MKKRRRPNNFCSKFYADKSVRRKERTPRPHRRILAFSVFIIIIVEELLYLPLTSGLSQGPWGAGFFLKLLEVSVFCITFRSVHSYHKAFVLAQQFHTHFILRHHHLMLCTRKIFWRLYNLALSVPHNIHSVHHCRRTKNSAATDRVFLVHLDKNDSG